MWVNKKGKWDDRHHKTERKSLCEKINILYYIICLFTYKRKFVHQTVSLWLKNWNQCVHMGGLMHGGLIHGVTQVLKKRCAYLWGAHL